MRHSLRSLSALLTAAMLVSGCGGGTDGTGAVPPAITSSGAMVKGSVILNGTHYDDSAASVSDDRGRTAAQLATGMVIKLRGRSDDGVSGIAERIDVENEVRGAIVSVVPEADPQRFEVGGLWVVVDSETRYANLAGFAELAAGLRVEVHGLRDADGLVRATRVEKVGARGVDGLDELRGAVSGVDLAADRFTLNGTVAVSYTGATFRPAGANESDLLSARVVEVRGSLSGSVFAATEVDIEDLEDRSLNGGAGEKQQIEGFITGFNGKATFQLGGRTVMTTATTKYLSGSATDLDNNVIVEVEGALDAQGVVLVATRIKFHRTRVILQGGVTAVDVGARTLGLLGQTAQANDLTRLDTRPTGGVGQTHTLGDIASGECVEVRGHLEGTTFVAEWIRELANCNNRDVVQARVLVKDEALFQLTVLTNLIASLPEPGAQYRASDDTLISRAQFLAAITAAGPNGPGTLVKVRGTFGANGLVADEAELKDE